MSLALVDTILSAIGKVTDKIWMDKNKKEQLAFDRDELNSTVKLTIEQMEQDGELKQIEQVFRESQAQRDYANQQFGTAMVLKDFFVGRIILMGRAAIRWVITGFAMIQAHRIVTSLLTPDVIKALADGKLDGHSAWLLTLLVGSIIGIPLFYVAGVSVEKILKSRGVL